MTSPVSITTDSAPGSGAPGDGTVYGQLDWCAGRGGDTLKKLCATCEKEYPAEVMECPDDGGKLLVVDDGDDDPLLGATIDGRYVVQGLLGQGGMGAVYQAHQKTMNRSIALKVLKRELSSDPQIVKRFLREVQAVSVLSHPNTITVYDFGQTPDNLLYIAMEYLEGLPLSDDLKKKGPMTAHRTLTIMSQVCGALQEAHEKGIVHRDLKPDNIFLATLGGKTDHVIVLDFGIAKLTSGAQQTQLTGTGLTVGTPPYMSPEQAEGRETITPTSDIYSLGCILFECLTGRPPFIGESPVKILMDHCTAEVPAIRDVYPNVQIGPTVERMMYAMLEKDPTKRPPAAKALQAQMNTIIQSGAVNVGSAGAIGMDETAAWDSSEVRASGEQAAAKGGYADPEIGLAPTGAWDSSEVAAAGGGYGPGGRPLTETAGEAVPASTAAAMQAVRRSPMVAIAGIAALLVVGVTGYFAFVRSSNPSAGPSKSAPATALAVPVKPGPEAAAEAAAVPAKPAEPEQRSIWIRSTPANAKVFEGDKELGATPVKVDVDLEKVRRFTVRLSGFKDLLVAVDPGMKQGLTGNLIPVAKRAPPRRARRKAKQPRNDLDDDSILVDDLK